MNPDHISRLESLLPGVISRDAKTLQQHSIDQVGDDRYAVTPAAVAFPQTTDDVVALVRWANETGTPITGRGAGSGLAGAAIPATDGVVCSFARMNRILEIDAENLMVTVEPGVITNALDKALEPHGLFFAGYPMSEDICFVGGNVAENAGGGRAVKYGVTGNYVIGAEVVTGAGEVLALGGKHIKDVTGYNFLQLLVGSEGTLGLFTRIVLRVIPRPSHRAVALATFADATAAAACVGDLRRVGAVSSIEFVDGATARATNDALPAGKRTPIPENANALLLVEVDDANGSDIDLALRQALDVLRAAGSAIIESGGDDTTSDRAWRLRKQVPWWVKRDAGPHHSLEDVVVPPAGVEDLVAFVDTQRERHQIPIALFGHAGDGNFHATPMKPADMSPDDWDTTIASVLAELYEFVLAKDGAISGEHGIGRKRVGSFHRFTDQSIVALARSVKAVFDPNGILNPGVIVADS